MEDGVYRHLAPSSIVLSGAGRYDIHRYSIGPDPNLVPYNTTIKNAGVQYAPFGDKVLWANVEFCHHGSQVVRRAPEP